MIDKAEMIKEYKINAAKYKATADNLYEQLVVARRLADEIDAKLSAANARTGRISEEYTMWAALWVKTESDIRILEGKC